MYRCAYIYKYSAIIIGMFRYIIIIIYEVPTCSKRNRWHFCENIGTVWNGVKPALRCLDITCPCILSFLLKDFSQTEQSQLMSTPQEQNVDWERGRCPFYREVHLEKVDGMGSPCQLCKWAWKVTCFVRKSSCHSHTTLLWASKKWYSFSYIHDSLTYMSNSEL